MRAQGVAAQAPHAASDSDAAEARAAQAPHAASDSDAAAARVASDGGVPCAASCDEDSGASFADSSRADDDGGDLDGDAGEGAGGGDDVGGGGDARGSDGVDAAAEAQLAAASHVLRELSGSAELVRIAADWQPPPRLSGRSCVYLLQLHARADAEAAPGCESDGIARRLQQHRRRHGERGLECVLVEVAPKSAARELEELTIRYARSSSTTGTRAQHCEGVRTGV
jgi:hypothetical protein